MVHGVRAAFLQALTWSLGCLLLIVVFSMQFDISPGAELSFYDECGSRIIANENVRDIAKWAFSILLANVQDFFFNQPFSLFLLSVLTVFLTRVQPQPQPQSSRPATPTAGKGKRIGKGLTIDVGSMSKKSHRISATPINLDILAENDSDTESESNSSSDSEDGTPSSVESRPHKFEKARNFHNKRRHSMQPPTSPSPSSSSPSGMRRDRSPMSTPTAASKSRSDNLVPVAIGTPTSS